MKFTFTFSLLVLVFAASSLAAEKPPSETIAPFLHENTPILARVRLEKIDLDRGVKTIVSTASVFSPQVAGQLLNGLTTFTPTLRKLKHQGVKEIYVVFSPTYIYDMEPYLYIPTPNGVRKQKVAQLMFSGDNNEPIGKGKAKRTTSRRSHFFELCETLGHGVFCGRAKTLNALKQGFVSKRTKLNSAFDSVKDRSIQILFVPSNDQRRVVSEIMPPLPKKFGSLTGRQLADGLQWVAVGFDIGEKSRFNFIVQSKTNANAQSMKKLMTSGLTTIAKLNPQNSSDLIDQLTPKVKKNRVLISFVQKTGEPGSLTKAFFGSIARAQRTAQKSQCRNNLHYLGIALHNFHDKYFGLPPRSNFDKNGKKLLSWRVFLLPYLGQKELYNQFHLDESWDSDHNKKLIFQMPDVFTCPSINLKKQGKTNYLAISHETAAFAEKTNRRFGEMRDGLSYTIFLLEVSKDEAVIWTKPDDFKIDWKNPTRRLGSEHGEKFHVLMGDGSVPLLSKKIDKDTFRALTTFAGKETIDRDKIK